MVTDSCTTLETTARTELDKLETSDDTSLDQSPKRPSSSPPTTARFQAESREMLLRKRAESADICFRPRLYKTRTIPEMHVPENDDLPRDPDKDSPNIFVSV